MKLSITCCLLALLLAASTARAEVREALLGLATDFSAKTVTIQVVSSGCTDRGDFRPDFSSDVLTFYRLRRDACKALPEMIGLSYTLEELGIDPHKPFRVGNPFIVNEHLAGMVSKPGEKQNLPDAGR
jgi:hypothetical protein